MTVKVYIFPDYSLAPPQADNGGIRRVVEAEAEHLHKFDIEVVHSPKEADVIQNHGGSLIEIPGIPNVHTGHGLYWSRQPWGDGYQIVNEQVVESMRHSVAWTVPSEWVNVAVRRGGLWYPETVYHGVDANKFKPSNVNGGYVLWNKARADYVSDPADMQTLAKRMTNRKFVSTIGRDEGNVRIVGNVSYQAMRKLVAEAGIYLSTVRETFGIGVLEALACGIPVAGFDWGGNSEIIIQGQTGWLAPPGDFVALQECVERCYADRARLSANAIEDVRIRWGWERRIEQYANIFKRVHALYSGDAPKVSILVTAYKLDQYLPECLESIQKQTLQNFECLVIDDAQLQSTEMIVRNYGSKDSRIRYVPTPNNFGLSGARNFGLSVSKGRYIRHLDADDFLAPDALRLEAEALDKDRGTDIVYGHLEVVREDGSRFLDKSGNVIRGGWPSDGFDWYQQMAHRNQLPSCVMARREVYERAGGYRERMVRNEDAEFWCRVTSLGMRAKKFTQAVTYFHRERADSKGAMEWAKEGKEPDWTAWFPWRMDTAKMAYMVPFGAQGKPPNGMRYWYVHDYAYPVVSVIVTCGPGHKRYLLDALDSIQAQNFPDWECIVVNDTGVKWDPNIPGAPWAKVVNMNGNRGAAAARNAGLRYTRGKYIIWMDADDYWLPWLLEKMVGYAEQNDGVIYSDFIMKKSDTDNQLYRYAEDFDPRALKQGCAMPGTSILIPRKIAQAIVDREGGWDEKIPGLEDWAYQLSICHAGFCFVHINEPLFIYRMYSSTKRETDYARKDEVREYVNRKYDDEAWRKMLS